MSTDAIRGKLLALLREYRLREVPGGLVRQFFTRSRMPPLQGMGLTWWLTPKGLQIRNELARMVVAALPHLNLDVDATADLIENVLQARGDDSRAFNWLAYLKAATVLDAKSVPEGQLSATLWEWIAEEAHASVAEWLVVVPLTRLKTATVDLGFDGLWLLNAADVDSWRNLSAGFDRADEWDLSTGTGDKNRRLYRFIPPETWGVCRITGTVDVAKAIARERFRTLIALLFAHTLPSTPTLLSKSGADPETLTIQFASVTAEVEYPEMTSHIGVLQPPTLSDMVLTDEDISKVRSWYAARAGSSAELQQRGTTGSHFIHYGYVADDLEQFIHFFVALDAFFGVRGKVEASIIAGIEKVFPGQGEWSQRAPRLFDLRSELLHGGSSSIRAWPEYENYRRHFKTEPQRDVINIATAALRAFFS